MPAADHPSPGLGIELAEHDRLMSTAEIPQTFSYHVFSCFQQRPPAHPRGSCAGKGAGPLWERLSQRLPAD